LVARACGASGLVGGQVLDLLGEGREATEAAVRGIHERKTGALMGAALELGGLLAGAPEPARRKLAEAGRRAGLAFQIADDLLDLTGSLDELGKSAGKDEAAAKLTYPRAVGVEAARREARRLADSVRSTLVELGAPETFLELVNRLVERSA
jgi:farnesyl diphosphate synthase